MDSSSMPNSQSDSTPSFYVPPGSTDPGWQYGYQLSKEDTKTVKCRLCSKLINGGINRLKQHLAHIKGNVQSCPNVDDDVKKIMAENLKAISRKRDHKATTLKETQDNVVVFEGVEDGGSSKKSCISDSNSTQGGGNIRQQSIKDAMDKEGRANVIQYIARWFYQAGIPFNVVTLKSFQELVEAIGVYGPKMKAPTYHEISETCLTKEVDLVRERLQIHRDSWKEYGCTIMTDAWTDKKGRGIMNFLVNCEKGTSFVKSFDVSEDSHTGSYIYELIMPCVNEVGLENVLQIVTDNASANLAAGKLLKEEHPRIFWTSCAAHTIDLMLEEIGKDSRIKNAITKARAVTVFFYSHTMTLSMMRKYTKNRDIVRPGTTRFATSYLSLQSIQEQKDPLRMMFSSDEWRNSKWSRTDKGKAVVQHVYNPLFWNNVSLAIKVFTPLVKLLRLVDGDVDPSMGHVYGGLEDAKKEIMEIFKNIENSYKPFVNAIISKAKGKLDKPLHTTAYLLNPFYYYRDKISIEQNEVVMNGFMECLDAFYPDLDVQHMIASKELVIYKNASGQFSKPLAVKMRSQNDKDYNPAQWWSMFGSGTPNLQKMAMRILKLTASSSGCERNWSTFEGIHTKKRNRLEVKKLDKLVYAQFNSKLLDHQANVRERGKDPLHSKDTNNAQEGLVEGGVNDAADDQVFEDDPGLTWGMVAEASGVEGILPQRQTRRSQAMSSTSTSSPIVEIHEEEEAAGCDENIEEDELNPLDIEFNDDYGAVAFDED